MNVLIADDQIGVIMTLALLIEAKGHQVTTAMDGKSALNMLKSNTYDIAFLDHSMPELSGLELIQYVGKHGIRTKTVMITADKGMERSLAVACGAHEYIEKPYDVNEILRILEKYSKA